MEDLSNQDDESVDIGSSYEHTMKDRFLTFFLGKEVYGLPIEKIIEIVGIQKITDVPDMASFVKGVINLRGQVIPVLDVRLRFAMEPRAYDDRTCIMVCRHEEVTVGLIVDTVEEVLDISDELISAPPQVATSQSSKFLSGIAHIGDKVVVMLSLNKILYEGITLDNEA